MDCTETEGDELDHVPDMGQAELVQEQRSAYTLEYQSPAGTDPDTQAAAARELSCHLPAVRLLGHLADATDVAPGAAGLEEHLGALANDLKTGNQSVVHFAAGAWDFEGLAVQSLELTKVVAKLESAVVYCVQSVGENVELMVEHDCPVS